MVEYGIAVGGVAGSGAGFGGSGAGGFAGSLSSDPTSLMIAGAAVALFLWFIIVR